MAAVGFVGYLPDCCRFLSELMLPSEVVLYDIYSILACCIGFRLSATFCVGLNSFVVEDSWDMDDLLWRRE